MRISQQKLNRNLRNQFFNSLCQVFADIRNPEEIRLLLEDLLPEDVLEMLIKKFGAAYYLQKGRTYIQTKNNLALSTATVAAVAKQMQEGKGLKIALKKASAEEWAQKWAERIGGIMKGR